MVRTYKTTKIKDKLSLLYSQTAVVQNCDLSISESVTLSSDSNFYEKSWLRGGGKTTSNDCKSESCVRQSKKSQSLTDRIVLNFSGFTSRAKVKVEASAAERANRVVKKEKANQLDLRVVYLV